MLNRRGFLGALAAALAGATLDPERLLWRPGAKTIFLPTPQDARVYTSFQELTSAVAHSISRQLRLTSLDDPPWRPGEGYKIGHVVGHHLMTDQINVAVSPGPWPEREVDAMAGAFVDMIQRQPGAVVFAPLVLPHGVRESVRTTLATGVSVRGLGDYDTREDWCARRLDILIGRAVPAPNPPWVRDPHFRLPIPDGIPVGV